MSKKKTLPYMNLLSIFEDLITDYEDTRAGFISLALEKNRRATRFVEEARILKQEASKATSLSELLKNENIQSKLLAASGLSEKSQKHLTQENKLHSIQQLAKDYLEPAGSNFAEELVFRFFINKG